MVFNGNLKREVIEDSEQETNQTFELHICKAIHSYTPERCVGQ